ncbi:psiF repeat-containing protein [Bosea sp. CRIB-10]|uniref:PsiF family protein n=1 Tax=Bosea sp. CRIB-10 TaxID=378404 RepID=UPI0008E3641D|nr:PsiF family protein [Bosea sp. CRIB-10]SFD37719.1 psiF repeat-containing protein [Bosea sp. CRIB-10]
MKTLILVTLAVGLSSAAFAQSQSCNAQATEKKLAGAAKTSFVTKCEKDAGAACDKQAADKKLSGAAKTSFTAKCVKDAVGT